jgi:hypothetical protein
MDRTLRFVRDQIEVLAQHARDTHGDLDPAFVHLHAICLVHETARMLGPGRSLLCVEDLLDAAGTEPGGVPASLL